MVRVELMAELLVGHPSPSLVEFVLSGLRRGFSIGFVGLITPGREAPNHSAVLRRPLVTLMLSANCEPGFSLGRSSDPLSGFPLFSACGRG